MTAFRELRLVVTAGDDEVSRSTGDVLGLELSVRLRAPAGLQLTLVSELGDEL